MIKSLTLKFGRGQRISAEAVNTTPITVFVGPNNSGKSRVLQELHQFFQSGQHNATDLIVDKVEFEALSHEKAVAEIERVKLKPHAGEAIAIGHILVGKKGQRHNVTQSKLLEVLQNCNEI